MTLTLNLALWIVAGLLAVVFLLTSAKPDPARRARHRAGSGALGAA